MHYFDFIFKYRLSLELVHTQGFQALTEANAAAAAGVRQSHLTYYFPTRNELLKAVVQHGVASILDSLSDGSSPDPKALARLRRRVTERICNHGMARIMIGLTLALEEDPSLKRWLAQFQDDMQKRLGTLLRSYGLRPTQEEVVMPCTSSAWASAMLSLGAGTEDAEAQANVSSCTPSIASSRNRRRAAKRSPRAPRHEHRRVAAIVAAPATYLGAARRRGADRRDSAVAHGRVAHPRGARRPAKAHPDDHGRAA